MYGPDYSFLILNNKKTKNKKERKSILRQKLYDEYKKIVPYPNLLEIEDIKSPNVVLLNKMKGLDGTVKVLDRWKFKNLFPKNYKKKDLDLGIPHDLIPNPENLENNRVFPKLGLTSVNPENLSKLFKPLDRPLTKFGEIFDFTWNFERKQCVPGLISLNLRKALGIKDKGPPPWLFKMQELGPPPGWPGVLFPGVNTDIPLGCVYGYEPSGWGKLPKNVIPRDIKDTFLSKNQYTSLSYLDDLDKEFLVKSNEITQQKEQFFDKNKSQPDLPDEVNDNKITENSKKNNVKKKRLTAEDKLKKKFKL
jgi:splicing factor 3B subunit 2